MKTSAIFLTLLGLLGCATHRAVTTSHSQEAANEFVTAKNYCNNLYADAALDPIRSKVALTPVVPATFEMLSNEAHVTPNERPVIREWAARAMQCQAEWNRWARLYQSPLHVTLLSGLGDTANALRAALHNGQISYGEYNRQRQKAQTEYDSAVAQLNAELARQGAEASYRAQQIEQQQYQTYLAVQQNALQQNALRQSALQQTFVNQHGSVMCNQIGSFTYCDY
jgi:hypothetical protein